MDIVVSIPLLKGRSLTPKQVKSVLNQEWVNLQLCISAEKTAVIPDFLETFSDPRVNINSSITNGIAGCHNYVLNHFNAEYYVLLAAETLLLPGSLANLVNEMRKNPEIGLSIGTGYYAKNKDFDLSREDFRQQYAQLDLMFSNRGRSSTLNQHIKVSRLHLITVSCHASSLLREGLNPEYKELAPFEFVMRGTRHGSLLEYTSALTIASTKPKKPSTREILSLFFQLAKDGWNKSSAKTFDFRQLFRLTFLFAFDVIKGSSLHNALRKYGQRLRRISHKIFFWPLNVNSWIDLIGLSAEYRIISESHKNWRLLRSPRKVQPIHNEEIKIAYNLWQFPNFTETFIRREIDELVSSGKSAQVFAETTDPNLIIDDSIQAWINRTIYIYPIIFSKLLSEFFYFLIFHPIKTIKLFLYILFHRYSYYKTLKEDFVVFGKTLHLTRFLKNYDIQHVHSPWANLTGFLSFGAAYLLNLPFTVHVRAYDINHWKSKFGLSEILENADCIFTNSEYNRSRINSITQNKKNIYLIRDGVDTNILIPNQKSDRLSFPVRILSVGRLIEPKGFVYLLQACALLVKQGISFECKIIGGRDFTKEKRSYMDIFTTYHALKLEEWVSFEGAEPFGEILKSYHWADVFVLACVKSQTGEHDITPNVILEAMAMELPVVSTKTGAIPEIITHRKTGLLVDPGDADALAEALKSLILAPDLRIKLGKAGRRQVIENYNISQNVSKMAGLFKQFQN